jgi:exosortase C (VPDSG-CTERM-specific)
MIPSITEKPITSTSSVDSRSEKASRKNPLLVALALLVLAFAKPLYDLVRFSLATELFSHILLIPVISGYLIWQAKASLPAPSNDRSLPLTILAALPGIGVLAAFFIVSGSGAHLGKADYLAFTILPFVSFLIASVLWFGGTRFARSIAFPLGFLIFLVPFPDRITDALEIASQRASADAYAWMLSLTRVPYFRNNFVFSIPGLDLQVAQECSGIRSSFVLFITGLLAGHMFLRSPWKKGLLALAVIPLGILRNGFRIWVLSILTTHWDPRVIDSPLHHKGGPIFFAISLIPFFLLLFWLRRSENRVPLASPSIAKPNTP